MEVFEPVRLTQCAAVRTICLVYSAPPQPIDSRTMNGNSPWAARVPPTTSVDAGGAATAGGGNDAAAAAAATAVVTFLSRVNQRLGAKGISPSSVHSGSRCRQ